MQPCICRAYLGVRLAITGCSDMQQRLHCRWVLAAMRTALRKVEQASQQSKKGAVTTRKMRREEQLLTGLQ